MNINKEQKNTTYRQRMEKHRCHPNSEVIKC